MHGTSVGRIGRDVGRLCHVTSSSLRRWCIFGKTSFPCIGIEFWHLLWKKSYEYWYVYLWKFVNTLFGFMIFIFKPSFSLILTKNEQNINKVCSFFPPMKVICYLQVVSPFVAVHIPPSPPPTPIWQKKKILFCKLDFQ